MTSVVTETSGRSLSHSVSVVDLINHGRVQMVQWLRLKESLLRWTKLHHIKKCGGRMSVWLLLQISTIVSILSVHSMGTDSGNNKLVLRLFYWIWFSGYEIQSTTCQHSLSSQISMGTLVTVRQAEDFSRPVKGVASRIWWPTAGRATTRRRQSAHDCIAMNIDYRPVSDS